MPHVPPPTTTPDASPTGRPGVKTLSVAAHHVDPDDVFRALFGKEPEVDSHTGELLYKPAQSNVAPASGSSPNAPPR